MSRYVVGQWYRVRLAYGKYFDTTDWWPVMGELHHDREHFRFPVLHLHIDPRFVSSKTARFVTGRDWRSAFNRVFVYPHTNFLDPITGEKVDKPVIREARRLCKRQMPEFIGKSIYPLSPTWIEFRAAYAGASMKHGMCPHRGYDLSQETPDSEGIVTCPLHGLRFCTRTGKAVAAPINHVLSASPAFAPTTQIVTALEPA